MLSFYENHKDKIKNARKQYHEKFYRLNKVNSRYKSKRDNKVKLNNNSNNNFLSHTSSSFNKIKKAQSFISSSKPNKMLITQNQPFLLNNKRSCLDIDFNYHSLLNSNNNKQNSKSPKPEPLPMKINLTHIDDEISSTSLNNKIDQIQEDKKIIYLLTNLGLEKLYTVFNNNFIKFNDLFLLTKEDFIEMKIPIGPRNRLIHFIREFLKFAKTFNFQELHDFFTIYKKNLNKSLINSNKLSFNNNCHPVINNFLNAGDNNISKESFEKNSNTYYKNNTYDKVNLSKFDNTYYKNNKTYCKKQINFDQINDNKIHPIKKGEFIVCLSEAGNGVNTNINNNNKNINDSRFSYDDKNVILINKKDLQNENIRNLNYELNKTKSFNAHHSKKYSNSINKNYYNCKKVNHNKSNTNLCI